MLSVSESSIRRLAKKRGYAVQKSRARVNVPNADDFGGYRLVDPFANTLVAGPRFDLSLEDILDWLHGPYVDKTC